jgi:hypothetical protein
MNLRQELRSMKEEREKIEENTNKQLWNIEEKLRKI